MELTKEAYKALEDIVGLEYITREPAIRDTYNQVWGNKLVYGEKWSVRPAAVLLPGNTKEVQAIVKTCNRYGIRFKPFSSGFEIVATALESEKSIILDLRRMDRILEIDAENMHAVVEPYVSVHRLQIEVAKHGLYLGSIGAGPSTGVIAAAICHFGSGGTSVFTGGLDRNVLGTEWVLPTGDILRLGTRGTGDGWFSAEGPGISLRGILRGHGGANGGHGVITKASVKLYPWYGPSEWQQLRGPEDSPIHRHLEKILDGYKAFVVSFPDEDSMFEALLEIGQVEIIYAVSVKAGARTGRMSEGNDEMWAAIQKMDPKIAKEGVRSLSMVMGASSEREMEYREKCLAKISRKWGGQFLPQLNSPDGMARYYASAMWAFPGVMMVFRPTTDFFISPTTDATEDMIRKQHTLALEAIGPYMKSGALMQGGVGLFNSPHENFSAGAHIENVYSYDPFNDFSLEETRKLIGETLDPKGKFGRFGPPLLGGALQIESAIHVHEIWGSTYDNYDVWLRKIKEMLDPNDVGDWAAYIPPVFP